MLAEMASSNSQKGIKKKSGRVAVAGDRLLNVTDWRHKGIHFIYVGSLQLLTNQEKALLLHKPLKTTQLKPGIPSSVHLMRD